MGDALPLPLQPDSPGQLVLHVGAGYHWEHGACVYFGGVLAYRRDPSDGVTKLWYNNGRGPYKIEPLCPDPAWPAGKDGANSYCWVSSSRDTKWV